MYSEMLKLSAFRTRHLILVLVTFSIWTISCSSGPQNLNGGIGNISENRPAQSNKYHSGETNSNDRFANSSIDNSNQGNKLRSENANSNVGESDLPEDIHDLPIVREGVRKFSSAVMVAREALSNDPELKPKQRDPSNYSIEVRQNSRFVFVKFGPRDRGIDPPDGSGETEFARDVCYIIRKSNQQLVERRFFK